MLGFHWRSSTAKEIRLDIDPVMLYTVTMDGAARIGDSLGLVHVCLAETLGQLWQHHKAAGGEVFERYGKNC